MVASRISRYHDAFGFADSRPRGAEYRHLAAKSSGRRGFLQDPACERIARGLRALAAEGDVRRAAVIAVRDVDRVGPGLQAVDAGLVRPAIPDCGQRDGPARLEMLPCGGGDAAGHPGDHPRAVQDGDLLAGVDRQRGCLGRACARDLQADMGSTIKDVLRRIGESCDRLSACAECVLNV